MKLLIKLLFSLVLICSSFEVVAAQNPVSWSLSAPFPSAVFIGRSYDATYTFTSNLPFTMVKALVIDENASPSSEFSYVDECSGVKLSHGGSCTVKITLTPTTSGKKSVQLILAGYSNDRVLVPALTTTAQGESVSDVYSTVTQNLPASLYLGQSGTYGFSFTNDSSADLTGTSVSVVQTNGATPTYTTLNCGSSLAKNQVCTINGTYTPTTNSPTTQTVTATLTYDSSKTVTASTGTDIQSDVGVVASFVGSNHLPGIEVPTTPTPAGPYTAPNYPTNTVQVLFTNTGPGPATITSPSIAISPTVGGTSLLSATGGNTCTNGLILAVGQACQMVGILDSSGVVPGGSAVPVTVVAAVTSSTTPTSVSLSSTTNIVATVGAQRTIKLVNECNFDVWYSLNGAKEVGLSCAAGCPTGTSCATNGFCYWTNPTPTTGSIHLTSGGGTSTVTIPATSVDPTVQWSGNISASLNCNGSSTCEQASCSNAGGSTPCLPSKGFLQPATQAEFTMLLNGADSYDVETINGFHIPISITPVYSFSPAIAAQADNYYCNSSAANPAASGFGVCDWTTAAPPSTYYNWVTTNDNAGCGSCPPSSTTQVCGLDSSFNYGCGKFLGYWSADEVCGSANVPAAIQTAFGCNTQLSTLSPTGFFPSGYTMYDLMACKVPANDTNSFLNSCYGTYSGVPSNNQIQCCGCIDWWTVAGIGSNSNSHTTSCTKPGQSSPQTDPVWNQHLQSTVEWMKKACPSAYVYPFDDETSTMTCTNTLSGSPNSTGYTITFCPNGNTGLPAGKAAGAEGRG